MKKYFLLAAAAMAAVLTFSACDDKPDKKEGYVTDSQGRRLVSKITTREDYQQDAITGYTIAEYDFSYDKDLLRPTRIDVSYEVEWNETNRTAKSSVVFLWEKTSVTVLVTGVVDGEQHTDTTKLSLNADGYVTGDGRDVYAYQDGYLKARIYNGDTVTRYIWENGNLTKTIDKDGNVRECAYLPNRENHTNWDFGIFPRDFFDCSFGLFGKAPLGIYEGSYAENKADFNFSEDGFLEKATRQFNDNYNTKMTIDYFYLKH